MRTIIDVPEAELEALSAVCEAEKLSRAEAIRRAIRLYVAERRPGYETAFGLWGKGEDALRTQRRLRREWDGRTNEEGEGRA